MKSTVLTQLAVAAAACVCSLAQAAPIVYTFTGTTLDLAQLGVTGSLTIDADLLTNVNTVSTNQTGNTPLSSAATISFSDGASFTLGAGQTGNTYEIVNRSFGSNYFNVGTAVSTPTLSATLQINTYDYLSAFASDIFQTAVSDLSFGQSVTFNTDGSFNTGTFSYGNNVGYTYAHAFSITSVTATPVTPVPEPETYALLLAGLGAVGTIAHRRRAPRC